MSEHQEQETTARVPDFVSTFLETAESGSLKRRLRGMTPLSAREVVVDGRRCVNFSSNDYLGLAFHPALVAESIRWTEKFGAGAGASRLVTGTLDAYLELEAEIADWKNTEAAILMGAGYMANIGLISALAGRRTVIFADKLNHASLNAGCRLSGAKLIRFRHNDFAHLEEMMERNRAVPEKIIVCDTVFSMDGDVTDTRRLRELSRSHQAMLYLDDAHATGVYGKHGEGMGGDATVTMSTFSKAMGSYGSCATCSARMKEYFVNRCGAFIYSTAMPPGVCGAISAAVKLVRSDEFTAARHELQRRGQWLRDELRDAEINTGASSTQIIPVMTGTPEETIRVSAFLQENNIVAVPIRPPTVPPEGARIRVSLNAAHTDADIEKLAEALKQALPPPKKRR